MVTPDGLVYELDMGRLDKFAEVVVSTVSSESEVRLGVNDNLTDGATRYTVMDVNGNWVNGTTADGNDFIVDFDLLTRLNLLGNDYSFKEVYLPIRVTTHYDQIRGVDGSLTPASGEAYTQEYTLKLTRVNDDNTLRAIQVSANTAGTVADYDNEDAAKPNLNDATNGWYTVENGVDVYTVAVDESQVTANVSIRATDAVAMMTTGVGVRAGDPKVGDPSLANLVVNLADFDEMVQIEIRVRAEEDPAGTYKTSYLRIIRKSSDAGLKDVFTVHPYRGLSDQPITTHGETMNSALVPVGYNGGYTVWVSSVKTTIPVIDLTALASKQGAEVSLAPYDETKTAADQSYGTASKGSATYNASDLTDQTRFAVKVVSS